MGLGGKLPNLRAIYCAEDEGWRLVHADASQLELRVMAAVSLDPVLRDALETGDVYTEDAKAIFRLPPETTRQTIKKAARQQAKIGHLAFQYGAGLATFYRQMLEEDRGLTWNNAKFVFDGLRSRYSGTVDYWYAEQERVRATGYSESRISRRRRTYPREPPITEIANWPIQSTAADHINLCMLALCGEFSQSGAWRAGSLESEFGDEARLIMQFHDAFDVECKKEIAEDVAIHLKQAMEIPRTIGGVEYTFPVEVKSGFLWSEV